MKNMMDIRRTAIRAMIGEQYPWVEVDDITVVDNTDWYEIPHFHVELKDDGKLITMDLAVVRVDVPNE